MVIDVIRSVGAVTTSATASVNAASPPTKEPRRLRERGSERRQLHLPWELRLLRLHEVHSSPMAGLATTERSGR